jgi:cytochrome P450
VGASFAWAEAVLVLATLARVWHPVAVAPSVRMRATATLRPADPIRMRVGRVDAPVTFPAGS